MPFDARELDSRFAGVDCWETIDSWPIRSIIVSDRDVQQSDRLQNKPRIVFVQFCDPPPAHSHLNVIGSATHFSFLQGARAAASAAGMLVIATATSTANAISGKRNFFIEFSFMWGAATNEPIYCLWATAKPAISSILEIPS